MDSILAKFFDGSISDEESAILSAWIDRNEENKRKFLDIYRIWNSLEFEKHEGVIDIDRELEIFRKNIGTRKRRLVSRRMRLVISYSAACIVLCVVVGIAWWGNRTSRPSDLTELTVPYGQRSEVTLSDGTKVWASAGSRLSYPATFDKRTREIRVDGQIYLDVAADTDRPFIVRTDRADVKVLGTEFGITAYGEEARTDIVLVSGSLAVSNNRTGGNTILRPDQMYVYDEADGTENVRDVDSSLHTLWLEGIYMFDRESFSDVLMRLSIYYGVEVDCEADAGKYLCSGKLNLNGGFDAVLAGLAYVVPISYTKEDDVYKIRLSEK